MIFRQWFERHMVSLVLLLVTIIMILIFIAVFYFGGFYDCLVNGNCPPPSNMSNKLVAGGM